MANGANDDLYDRIVDSASMSKLFEVTVQEDVKKAIEKHKKKLAEITVKSPKSPLVKKEVDRFVKETYNLTKGHLTEYGASQLSFHENNLHKSYGTVYKVKGPKKSVVLTDLVGMNIQGDKTTLNSQLNAIGSNQLVRIQAIVNRGISKGLTNTEMTEEIMKTTKITETQASALVRTAITRTANAATAEVMKANKDLLKGYQFVAILDSRTSEICRATDGGVFDIDDEAHLPPLHWRCRSTIIPIAKSFNELLETESPDVKKEVIKTIPAATRKKLDGRSIQKEGYGNWLKRQSYETKLRHFGNDNAKVALFDKGEVELDKFTTPKGLKVSVPTLRRLDTYATRVLSQRRAIADSPDLPVKASKPTDLMRDKTLSDDLRDFYINEASSQNSTLSLVDYKGTSLPGMRQSRRSSSNILSERSNFIDPVTGELKNSWMYEPDFNVYQERLDFLKASKILNDTQKEYIGDLVMSLDDKMTVNQQSAVLENLRINFERFYDSARPSYKQEWDNLDAIIRSEMANSVVNVSKILDRRSRSRSQSFDFFTRANSEESALQINGKWMTYDELSKNLNKDRAAALNWKKNYGNPLARKAYFTGKAPLRYYFSSPIEGVKTPKKWLEAQIKATPGGAKFLDKLKGVPTKSAQDQMMDYLKGPYNRMMRNEVNTRQALFDMREELLSDVGSKHAIDALSNIFEQIASGTTTDYDSLAIQVGKTLYAEHPLKFIAGKENKGLHILGTPSLKEYHTNGSKILTSLQKNKMIRVTPRGITRRAVTDLDTGRPDGSWTDTVSREVVLLDENLRALQETNRRLYVANRIGITETKNRLVVDPNAKRYKTWYGTPTDEKIITRRANVHYDKIQIDRDIANEINWANSTEWRVDDDYADFMLDLVRFRDPRGNVKLYDDLNGVRQIVIQRGEAGLGLMQTVKWHKDRGKTFTNTHQIDSRGRIYAQGYLTPTGGEFVRPFLNTGKSSSLGRDGYFAFQEQVGSLLGPTSKALTNEGRFEIFRDNGPALLDLGEKILAKTQRDRRIREVLQHPLVTALDAEEHPKLMRYALEYARIYKHANGNMNDFDRIASFKTSLPVEIDASASGAQIIALTTRNKALAELSNVVATSQKNRLYDIMAQDAISDPRFKALGRLPSDLTWEQLSKGAKAQNMVAFYGAGSSTQSASLADNLAKELLKKDYVVVTRKKTGNTPKEAFSQLDLNKIFKQEIDLANKAGATETAKDLQVALRELNDVIDKDAPVGSMLRKMARDSHPDVQDFVDRISSTNAGLVGPNEFKVIATIMSEQLSKRAPVTETFIKFWKGVAQDYILETKKVDIPWVTFDGKVMRQRYRPTVEEAITWIDPNTGRRVKNIYRSQVDDGKFIGKSSIIDARTGLGVSGNHSNDAAIVRRFHLWGRKNNIPTASIHDAFVTNVADATKAKAALRIMYGDAVNSNTIMNTLNQMRKDGMSRATYNKYVQQAKDYGLLPDEDALTRDDVLAPLGEGEFFYGIGP